MTKFTSQSAADHPVSPAGLAGHQPARRGFVTLTGATIAGGALGWAGVARAARLAPLSPGIKICAQIVDASNAEELQFVRQMGVEYVCTWTKPDDVATYQTFADIKRLVEAAGLKLWNVGNRRVHNMDVVTLGLPGRD